MEARARLEDWTNVVLGTRLLRAPFAPGRLGMAAESANAFVVGAPVIVLAATALCKMDLRYPSGGA